MFQNPSYKLKAFYNSNCTVLANSRLQLQRWFCAINNSEFIKLVNTPTECSWQQKQTMFSSSRYIIWQIYPINFDLLRHNDSNTKKQAKKVKIEWTFMLPFTSCVYQGCTEYSLRSLFAWGPNSGPVKSYATILEGIGGHDPRFWYGGSWGLHLI